MVVVEQRAGDLCNTPIPTPTRLGCLAAIRDHHLDQVRNRRLKPEGHECVAKRSVPNHHHVGRDFARQAPSPYCAARDFMDLV